MHPCSPWPLPVPCAAMTISAGGPTEAPPATAGFEVTAQQRRYFETFGFIRFDGLFADDVADITAAFDQVVSESGPAEDVDDSAQATLKLAFHACASLQQTNIKCPHGHFAQCWRHVAPHDACSEALDDSG